MKAKFFVIGLIIGIAGFVNIGLVQPASAAEMKYLVGLGDSRAAGAGLPMAEGVTKNYTVECKRSPYAAIAYLASWTNTPVISHACSGATTDDLYSSTRVNGTRLPAQIDQVPGFVLSDKGTVFVIQTGPNDIGWTTILTHCARNVCGDQKRETIALKALLLNYERRLHTALLALREKGATGHVVVTGVYNPVPNNPALLKSYGISDSERTWIVSAINEFNARTKHVASKHKNVSYVANSLSSDQLQKLSGTMPFHPTIEGQKTTARQIQSVLATAGYN